MITKKPIVTVAIASYNNAKYIERCLDSVFTQSYSNLEVLLVDDGSTDDTFQRIERFESESRLNVIQKENGGLSTVRQRALDEANGDFICFIDADDYLHTQYVELMLNKLVSDKSDICICSTVFVNEKLEEITTGTMAYLVNDSKATVRPDLRNDDILTVWSKLLLSDSWNKLYRINFLRKAGVHFCIPKGLNGSDKQFNNILALHCPSYSTISNKLYYHIIYSRSAVHRKNKNLLRSFEIICDCFVKEARILNLNKEKSNILVSNMYIESLRASCQDLYNQNGSFNFFIKDLPDFNKRRLEFLKNHSEITCNYRIVESFSLKIFCWLVNNAQFMIPLYLFFRKRVL